MDVLWTSHSNKCTILVWTFKQITMLFISIVIKVFLRVYDKLRDFLYVFAIERMFFKFLHSTDWAMNNYYKLEKLVVLTAIDVLVINS